MISLEKLKILKPYTNVAKVPLIAQFGHTVCDIPKTTLLLSHPLDHREYCYYTYIGETHTHNLSLMAHIILDKQFRNGGIRYFKGLSEWAQWSVLLHLLLLLLNTYLYRRRPSEISKRFFI